MDFGNAHAYLRELPPLYFTLYSILILPHIFHGRNTYYMYAMLSRAPARSHANIHHRFHLIWLSPLLSPFAYLDKSYGLRMIGREKRNVTAHTHSTRRKKKIKIIIFESLSSHLIFSSSVFIIYLLFFVLFSFITAASLYICGYITLR